MIGLDLGKAMRDAQADPQAMTEIMRRVAEPLGATDLVVYLVDFAQTVLALCQTVGHMLIYRNRRQ